MKKTNKYIHEWNNCLSHNIKIHDETLREGIQSLGSAVTLEEKKEYLDSVLTMPVSSVCLGFPASGAKIYDEIDNLIPYIISSKSDIAISCAARTTMNDIAPIIKLSQKYGCNIKVNAFIGTSQIRQYIEKWDIKHICSLIRKTVEYVKSQGLDICIITEDTTRTSPEMIKAVYMTAIEAGCNDICFCDTVGHVDFTGIYNLFQFIKEEIALNNEELVIEWHGHNDRGMALENSLFAAMMGADIIHVTSFGIGERCGNTPLELLLLNLSLMGNTEFKNSLKILTDHCYKFSEIFKWKISENYPVWGENAFTTVSGVHASAIYKAFDMPDNLIEKVYSFIEPSLLGRQQIVKINYMSGKSNVLYWMKNNRIKPDDRAVEDILEIAKTSIMPLPEELLWKIVHKSKNR